MNTLPEFPNFRIFTIDDTQWYYDFYLANGLNPYADINPENLFVWLNINGDLGICKTGNIIILRYTNVLDSNHTNVLPLSKNLDNSTVDTLTKYLIESNQPPELHEVPSVMCENLDKDRWALEDDSDNFEYILDTTEQTELEGNDFSRQRRRINFFEREHPTNTIKIQYYPEINEGIKNALLHHINTMPLNSNAESSKHNIIEPIAIKRNLEYSHIFHKKALIIKIDDKIVSYAIISFLDDRTAAINHLKVDYSVQYIFQYSIYQLAKILKTYGINEMNIEQDLGIEGLRTFKQRLQPSRMLEKKTIRPRL